MSTPDELREAINRRRKCREAQWEADKLREACGLPSTATEDDVCSVIDEDAAIIADAYLDSECV